MGGGEAGKKKADGKEETAQPRATTERGQGRAEYIDEITQLPDNLSVLFPHIFNSLGLEHATQTPWWNRR